ncbi:MAG TPA: hypothetical protein VJI71_02985, partial [Candidatus Norongarragalinales archaeon]|nr:hypothetical protein [Candidatus Norongarragalinales archaeon]
ACTYQLLPKDYSNAIVLDSGGVTQSITIANSSLSWNCDFTKGNYTIGFATPAVVLSDYGWMQNNSIPNSIARQNIFGVQGVKNPSAMDYSNVSGDYSCPQGFSCSPTSFAVPSLAAGEEQNQTIAAQGSAVSSSESIETGDYYNKTVELANGLFELQNVSAEFAVPPNLRFKLFVFKGGIFVEAGGEYSFSVEGETAGMVFPALAKGATVLLLSAERKEDGTACAADVECVSDYCFGNQCKTRAEEFDPTPTPIAEEGEGKVFFSNPAATPSPKTQDNETLNENSAVEKQVDIRIESEIEPGRHEIGFFVNGLPVEGIAKISDPGGNQFLRQVENGFLNFFFDKEGRWRIAFGNATKEITVIKKAKPTPTMAVLKNGASAGAITALAAGKTNYWLWVLALALLIAAMAARKALESKVKIKRVVDGKSVEIKVKNNLCDAESVRVFELVPEGSCANYSSEPQVRETVLGDLLEWRFESIPKGSKIVLKHDYFGKEEELKKPVEVRIETGKEGRKTFFG